MRPRVICWLLPVLLAAACTRPQPAPERAPHVRGAFSLAEDLRQHTDPRAGADLDPALSPDGVHLAFASRRDGPFHNIYQKNLRRQQINRVTAFAAQDRFPEFSPDGRWLAFASDRDGNWDIWLAPALRGGALRQLSTSTDDEIRPTWSPDGKRLAYSARNRHGHWSIWICEEATGRVWDIGPGLFPSWSPDGGELVFQKIHPTIPGWSTLWIWSFATGRGSEVYANEKWSALFPSWAPAGDRIVFAVRPAGLARWWEPEATALWILPRRREPPVLLFANGDVLGAPVWAADGRIYFPSQREGIYAIWSVRIKQTAVAAPAPAAKKEGEKK